MVLGPFSLSASQTMPAFTPNIDPIENSEKPFLIETIK
jgi:hypothetical protein